MYVFLHFHKAAGISVLTFLNQQGLKFHKQHYSANPWNKHKTKPIVFWNFPKKKLQKWSQKLETKHRTGVIACEWNFIPEQNMLPTHKYITCLRDPFKRYLSNFVVERFLTGPTREAQKIFRQGKTTSKSLQIFLNEFPKLNLKRTKRNMSFKLSYNKPNYYVRMLNNLGESPNVQMTEEHLEKAKEILKKFEIILIIDYPPSFQQLKKHFNSTKIPHANSMKWKKPTLSQIPESIISEFKKRNHLDYQLYEYAKQLIDQRNVQ